MATYYVRHDGTVVAANKELAIDPTSASASLSLAESKLCSFAPGDTVVFSARGGDFSTGFFQVPSSGEPGRPITYKGEDGYQCVFTDTAESYHFNIISKHDVVFQNMVSKKPLNSGFRVIGNSFNILGRDLTALRSGNQGFQHEEHSGFSPRVEYENIVGAYNVDDGMSMHDASSVVVRGGRFFGNDQGINYIDNSKMSLYDVVSFGNTAYDLWVTQQTANAAIKAVGCYFGGRVTIDSLFNGENWMDEAYFERCRFGGASGANQVMDMGGSNNGGINSVFVSCLFENIPATKYGLVLRGSVNGGYHTVENCTITNRVKTGNGLFFGPNVNARLRNVVINNCTTGMFGYVSDVIDSRGLAMYGNTNNFSAVTTWNPTIDISTDPLFKENELAHVRTSGGNWMPGNSSPLINAASVDTVVAKYGLFNEPLNGTIGAIQIA